MRIGDTEFVTSESEVHKRNSLVIERSKGLGLCNSEAEGRTTPLGLASSHVLGVSV